MVDTVLNIINNARGRAEYSPLSATDFDSGQEAEHLFFKHNFKTVYKKVLQAKGDDTRKTFQFNTIQGVNTYSLDFDFNKLSSLDLYRIDSTGTQDYKLRYLTEAEALLLYPDFSDIPEGTPEAYFLTVTDTAGVQRLKFINSPDGVYTLKGFTNSNSNNLTATDMTVCNELADNYIEQYLLAIFLARIEHSRANIEYQEADNQWKIYLATQSNLNSFKQTPYVNQHY